MKRTTDNKNKRNKKEKELKNARAKCLMNVK